MEPIVEAMVKYIRAQPLIQSDETPVRMQLADGQMETARLWAYGLPWAEVVFDFRTDKSQKGPKEFLQGTTLSLEARLQLRQHEAKPIFTDVGLLIATLRKDLLPRRNDLGLSAHFPFS